MLFYYMASSASRQDERNRALWLATRLARWSDLARSGLPAESRKQNFPKSHIINPLLTKFARSRWLDIGLVLFFCEFMDLDFVSVHKHARKELGQYPAILTSHLVNNPYILHRHLEMTKRQPIAAYQTRFSPLPSVNRQINREGGFEKRVYTVNPIPQHNVWTIPTQALLCTKCSPISICFPSDFQSRWPISRFPTEKNHPKFHFPYVYVERFLSTINIWHRPDAITKEITVVFSADQTSENYAKIRVPYPTNGQLLYVTLKGYRIVVIRSD